MTTDEQQGWLVGDEHVTRTLITRESPRLFVFALGLARDRAAAEELAHDTWVRAYERRASFDGRGSFAGWLLAICRSLFHDECRRARRREALTDAAAHGEVEPPDLTELLDQRARLTAAMAQLPPRQRAVLLARLVDARSTRETAEFLGMAEGTVKATLAAALRNLRPLVPELRP